MQEAGTTTQSSDSDDNATTSGVVDAGTQDEGSTTSGDSSASSSSSSSSTGEPTVCGDGIVDEGEACDRGEDNDPAGECLPDCVAASCGDGQVQAGVEECDDGNSDDTDDCTTACRLPVCGDGAIQADEECDNGENNNDSRACKSNCTLASCGDADVHAGEEQCDDGNTDNNDGCTELCTFTDCGDGFWNPEINEICDDGLGSNGDECNDDCLTWGLWTDSFNGTASSNDEIYGVAFDPSGNVVVTGVTYNVGVNGDDVWLRKYDATGAELWTRTHHGVTSDIGRGVAVAPDGEIFVVGSVFTASENRDIWLRSYSSAGAEGFTRTFNGSAGEADEAHGVALDGAGNIVVVGYATTANQRDIWIRKYGPGGSTVWTRTQGGTATGNDEAFSVAVDSGDNVVVAGAISSGGDEDVWVRKYDSGGTEQWTHTYDGASGGFDGGAGVVVDSADSIIVVGHEETAAQGDDVWIRKYNAAGGEQWTQTFNGPSNNLDRGKAVAVGPSDEITAAGLSFESGESDNVWMRRYDTDGNVIWTVAYNSPGFQADSAEAVAVDPAGNTAVGGISTRSELGEARNTWLRYMVP